MDKMDNRTDYEISQKLLKKLEKQMCTRYIERRVTDGLKVDG